jgi:hypothetical protein
VSECIAEREIVRAMTKNKKRDRARSYAKRVPPEKTARLGDASAFPRFTLAAMRGIDPKAINTETPLGRLILVLAVAFNDLKGIMLFHGLLRGEARLQAGESLSSSSQYAGLVQQIARFMAGMVHELMVELKEDQTAAIESPEFQRIIQNLTYQARGSWQALLQVARGEEKTDTPASDATQEPADLSYADMLVRIRNSVAFHYSAKALARGYREHFADASRPHSTRAVFSDGRSMEDTRFFFADAAAIQAVGSVTGLTSQTVLNRTAQLAGTINLALKPIVTAYVRSFSPRPYPGDPSPPLSDQR